MTTDTLYLGEELAAGTVGLALIRYTRDVVATQVPDLADMFPLTTAGFRAAEVRGSGWVGFVVNNDPTVSVACVDKIREAESDLLTSFFHQNAGVPLQAQADALVAAGLWTSQQFACALPMIAPGTVSWTLLRHLITEWLNRSVVPEVLRTNEARVLRALPSAPSFDFSAISASLVVLEDEGGTTSQGTGFFLAGVGLVSCAHVLCDGMRAFAPRPPFTRIGVRVVRQHSIIDLAVLETEMPMDGIVPLRRGNPNALRTLSRVAAVGFPGYRVGDTGTIMPGEVVGYRVVSGIRRLMTNATIVGGMSGGPVVIDSQTAIGVCVTGADQIDNIENTADRGVIPIDALDLLSS
jgi:S1-C subfamily serine protease